MDALDTTAWVTPSKWNQATCCGNSQPHCWSEGGVLLILSVALKLRAKSVTCHWLASGLSVQVTLSSRFIRRGTRRRIFSFVQLFVHWFWYCTVRVICVRCKVLRFTCGSFLAAVLLSLCAWGYASCKPYKEERVVSFTKSFCSPFSFLYRVFYSPEGFLLKREKSLESWVWWKWRLVRIAKQEVLEQDLGAKVQKVGRFVQQQ